MVKKLNLGCGSTKIKGCINIDVEKSCKPDLVHDFLTKPLPYRDGTISEVYLFHTIEHLKRVQHARVLSEIHRVLKPNGIFMVSYPEFLKCVENWKTNKDGQKQFWEATIFGRQLYPSDHHVCIMNSVDFTGRLLEMGFKNIRCTPEPNQDFNTIISCQKGNKYKTYEELIREDMAKIRIESV